MKKEIYQIIIGVLVALLPLGALVNLTSCQGKDEPMKWVDLRYNPKDAYFIPAQAAEAITFEVKSTDPWEVMSQTDWCSASPNHGPADKICQVTLNFKENTDLDDRTDTITIKSDYWVGKRFIVTQKGIAYLELRANEDTIFNKDVDQKTIGIQANQDWSAEVTDGAEWLSILAGATGKQDGTVTVESQPNKGEQRSGEVTIYDRHHVKMATVIFVQDGLLLRPQESIIKTMYEGKVLKISVESNAEWTVHKADEDIEWFTLPATTFTGNAEIEIVLDENTGNDVRKAELILSTKAVEGVQPVVKNIVLKQAHNPKPTRYEFNSADLGGRWTLNNGSPRFDGDATFAPGRVTQNNCEAGYYSFRLKSMSADAMPVIFFTYGSTEIRWFINAAGGVTDISTTPWIPEGDSKDIAIDIKQPHTMSLNLTDSGGFMKIEWILDDQVFATHVANGSSTLELKYGAKSLVYLGCSKGSAVFDWYEYTPPINWGD